jgi:hypothetical protein
MTRGQSPAWMAAAMTATLVALPAAASAAEVLTASPQRDPILHFETGASYVSADAFGGWGLSLRVGWLASRYLMTGVGLETARLHADGTVPVSGGEFSQTFNSTLAAAFVRAQLPTRFVAPYAELALGYTAVHGMTGFNYQCKELGSAGGGVAIGVDVRVRASFSVGLRGGVRTSSTAECGAVGGPFSYEPAPLKTAAVTLAYRW